MPCDYQAIWQQLDATCRKDDYAGWDPFDGLNSKLFQCSGLQHSRWMRLAWLQLFKRLPVNLRAMALVPKTHNAKALALFTRSYLLAGDRESARYCADKMLALRCDEREWGRAAWGYPFDWQAKAFFLPSGVPNVICTTYAVLALEAMEQAGLEIDPTLYVEAAQFVRDRLVRQLPNGQRYITYIPLADTLVHNANLWGAYVCLKGAQQSGDESLKTLARDAIQVTLDAQTEEGAWPYGTMSHHLFKDSFHTGYNLEALHRMNEVLEDSAITQAIDKGMEDYLRSFFREDGAFAYYHDRLYPLDPHVAAQAVLTCQQVAPGKYDALMDKVLAYACDALWDEGKQVFHYQQTQRLTIKIAYMRWTQAWMHLALQTRLNAHR